MLTVKRVGKICKYSWLLHQNAEKYYACQLCLILVLHLSISPQNLKKLVFFVLFGLVG